MKKSLLLSVILGGIVTQSTLLCTEEVKQQPVVKQSVIKQFVGKAGGPLANLALLGATSLMTYGLPTEYVGTHSCLELIKLCIGISMLTESHQNLSAGERLALNSLIVGTIAASLKTSFSILPHEDLFLSDTILLWTAGLDIWESMWDVKPCIENVLKKWANS